MQVGFSSPAGQDVRTTKVRSCVRPDQAACPNFAQWPSRLDVVTGRKPVTRARHVTDSLGLQGRQAVRRWPNLRASVAMFRLEQA